MGLSEFFGIKKIDKTRIYAPDGGADLFVDSALREWDLDDTPAERELSEESRDLHDKLYLRKACTVLRREKIIKGIKNSSSLFVLL